MIDPTIITVLVEAAKAAGPLLAAFLESLTDDHREAVIEALERDTRALDAVPSTAEALASIASMYERHRTRVQAHEQARGNMIRDRFGVMDTTRLALRRLADGGPVSHEDRDELRPVLRLVDAALRGEVAVVAGPLDPTLPVASLSIDRMVHAFERAVRAAGEQIPEIDRAELARSLAAPVGAWTEPAHEED